MLTAHGVTHTGHVRTTNEDTLLIDLDLGLFLVADGMGGHAAGNVAARLTADTIRSFVARSRDGDNCTWPFGIDPDSSLAANRLRTAVQLANRRVFRESERRNEYTGMGDEMLAGVMDSTGSGVAVAVAAQQLLDAALERGGHDNITAVLVRRTA